MALSAFLALLVLVVVVGGLRRVLRGTAAPVGDLVEAAGRVEAGEIGTQVEVRGPSEVRSLARAFNAMSTRLEETDASRRRLLADVSHELRTPLTVMQGTLEGILDGLYPADEAHLVPVLEETRVLARLIDDLRTLSLSEAGVLRLHREPTDLARLIQEVVAGHRAAADDAGVAINVEAPGDLRPLEVDPSRIRQVIGNLVANALRFTPAGGRVSVDAGQDADETWVRVQDTGPGIDAGVARACLRPLLPITRLAGNGPRPSDRQEPGTGPRRPDLDQQLTGGRHRGSIHSPRRGRGARPGSLGVGRIWRRARPARSADCEASADSAKIGAPRAKCSGRPTGEWPSGKAPDSGSGDRRFESFLPSHSTEQETTPRNAPGVVCMFDLTVN